MPATCITLPAYLTHSMELGGFLKFAVSLTLKAAGSHSGLVQERKLTPRTLLRSSTCQTLLAACFAGIRCQTYQCQVRAHS